MTEENNTQAGQDGQGNIENPMDAIKQLREENAARRVENNELKALLTSVLEAVTKGQAPQEKPEQVKSEKGQELFNQINQTLEGMNTRLGAAEKTQSELETLKQQLDLERQERGKAQLQADRVRIGAKYKLPEAITERLQGSTLEELEADAQKIAPLVGNKGQSFLGATGDAPPQSQAKAIFERARGGNISPFSPEFHKSGGPVTDNE